jgi:hypothetical protein
MSRKCDSSDGGIPSEKIKIRILEAETMAKDKRKRKTLGGDLYGMAFIYWNEIEKRYELKIENKLKAYTQGETKEDHDEAKKELRRLAEEKGYTVYDA